MIASLGTGRLLPHVDNLAGADSFQLSAPIVGAALSLVGSVILNWATTRCKRWTILLGLQRGLSLLATRRPPYKQALQLAQEKRPIMPF